MVVHQGTSMDRELAQVWYTDALEEAALGRADKHRRATHSGAAARQILLGAVVVGLVLVIWLVVAL
jgi:hypothetical protein